MEYWQLYDHIATRLHTVACVDFNVEESFCGLPSPMRGLPLRIYLHT